jgi:hypothetical protein
MAFSLRNLLDESVRLLGFKIGTKTPEQENKSFAIPPNLDGSTTLTAGGIYGTYVDLEGSAKNEAELIIRYRDMSMQPECDEAIDNIINDAIVQKESEIAVQIDLEKLEQSDSIKDQIRECFEEVMMLLNFQEDGVEIFKRWYTDGRLYYHIIIDEEHPENGIQEVRYLDPRRIRPIRQINKKIGPNGVEIVDSILRYYVYNERGIVSVDNNAQVGQKIAEDAICYVHSGQVDTLRNMVVSYLHRAIKPLNQLRAIEDAQVIYRLSRAAERRVFYIDVGNMPTQRAEAYVKNIMADLRNKLVYDSATGEVRDDKKFLSMQEDFFLPRREGGKGTEVTTLPGAQNLAQMEDVNYFQERLYKALKVPVSRLKSDQPAMGFGGKIAEISRDERNFSRYIDKLRKRFNHLFYHLLKIQMVLKGIILLDEWEALKEQIYFQYQKDSFYAEVEFQEVLNGRLSVLTAMGMAPGDFYSKRWVATNVLKMTDEDIEEEKKEMEKELEEAQDKLDADARREAGVDQDGKPFVPPEPKEKPNAK